VRVSSLLHGYQMLCQFRSQSSQLTLELAASCLSKRGASRCVYRLRSSLGKPKTAKIEHQAK